MVNNYIVYHKTNLDYDGLKKQQRFIVAGEIQRDQNLKISVSVDEGAFIEIGTISGNGSYVDKGQNVSIGATTIGKKEIGGGGEETANPYQREINICGLVDKFEKVKVRFEATAMGYASVSRFGFKDLRYKGRKIPNRYIS